MPLPQPGKGLTRANAKAILHEGTVRGHPITEKQRRYFGAATRKGFRGKRNPDPNVWSPSALKILSNTESPPGGGGSISGVFS